LKFPEEDRRLNSPKLVRIIIVLNVDADGIVKDMEILKGGSKTLNQEALRVIRLFENKLCPAIHQGRPFESKFSIPVTFRQM
jgi:TonB family protein